MEHIPSGFLFIVLKDPYRSSASSTKIFSTATPKTRAMRKARTVDGINLPDSIALMVCLDTLTFSANSACVIFCIARSTLIVFFMCFACCAGKQELRVKNNYAEHQNKNDKITGMLEMKIYNFPFVQIGRDHL